MKLDRKTIFFKKNYLIVGFLLFCTCLIEQIESKKLFSDLLTNDNEIILVEPAPKILKKNNVVNSKNNTKNSTLANNSKTKSTTIKTTTKPKAESLKPTNDDDTKSKPAKIIVNVIYASSKNSHLQNTNDLNSHLSSTQLSPNINQIVYTSSDYLSPCDRPVCKSTEVCVIRNFSFKNINYNYECVPKPGIQETLIEQELNHRKKRETDENIEKQEILKAKCSNDQIIDLKLKVYERFESISKSELNLEEKKYFSETQCILSVAQSFALADLNQNHVLDLNEWVDVPFLKSETCSQSLFARCDLDHDQTLSYNEYCSCFDGVQHKCKFIRNQSNRQSRQAYISYLNQKFATITKPPSAISEMINKHEEIFQIKMGSYIHLCNADGYFKLAQCDKHVNCWCVNRKGEPYLNTMRKIYENPVDCNTLS